MARMSDERMIRVENLKLLMRQHDHTQAEVARQLGCTDTYVRKMLSGKPGTLGEKAARKVEEAYKKPRFWMDGIHAGGDYDEQDLIAHGVVPLRVEENRADYPINMGEGNPPLASLLPHGTDTSYPRAPVVEWARLGEDLYRANSEWPTSELRAVPTRKEVSERVKWVPVADDSLSPDIKRGDLIAIDPAHATPPARDQVVLLRTPDGTHILRKFIPLANSESFEAIDAKGHTLDSQRHGLVIAGIVVGSFREL